MIDNIFSVITKNHCDIMCDIVILIIYIITHRFNLYTFDDKISPVW